MSNVITDFQQVEVVGRRCETLASGNGIARAGAERQTGPENYCREQPPRRRPVCGSPGASQADGVKVKTLLQNIEVLSAGTNIQKDNEGKPVQVHVYTRYPRVRLELNGKVIDEKVISPQDLTATFEINYQPGSLKAIAIYHGKPVDTVELQTAGKPARIHLAADRSHIKASRNDLAYVTAEIIDANGRLVPDAIIPLHFTITGNGEIAATASASPNDMQSFQKPDHRTFRGKCLIIVRPKGKAGKITLRAEGAGFTAAELVIETK